MENNKPTHIYPNLAWGAIHKTYQQHQGLNGAKQPVPQPEGLSPMHGMMVHALATRDNDKDGESHSSMIIRALSEHLKRITPNVADIHKNPSNGGK